MKHIRKDNFYTNVDLVSGQLKYNWVDSLSAFWPGLQVLAGDVPNAEQAWSKYYFAWRKYQVGLPERFDFLQYVVYFHINNRDTNIILLVLERH